MRHGRERTLALYKQLLIPVSFLVGCCSLHALPENQITDPAVLIGNLDENARPESMLAEARIEYYGKGVARKGKVTIMTVAPDNLRIDVVTFTDDLLSVLAVQKDEFSYFERGYPECLKGPLCAAPMVAQFPMLDKPDQLIALLTGQVPLLSKPDEAKLEFSREEGLYLLRLSKGNVQQIARVGPDGKTVTGVVMKSDGKTVAEVEFSGKIDAGSTRVPRRLRLKVPKDELDISLDYREVETGYEFKGNPFEFQCPKGTNVRWLECFVEAIP